jgi:hypothetical protein
MFGGLVAGALAPLPAWADAGAAPLALLVGGPDGQLISRWADALALGMGPYFPGLPQIVTQAAGGLDGVTGANHLDTLVVPDGKTAAILPGAALIAWLMGDSRVHFDPTRWVPVLAGGSSGVLVARLPANGVADYAALNALAPLRLAVDEPQSNDLAALLALGRMRVAAAPVFGLRAPDERLAAFVAGEVDAVLLSGENVPDDLAALSANGGAAFFSLGAETPAGSAGPDPLFPALPDALGFAGAGSPLDNAYRAAAAAVRLDFFMVLPKLTDPSQVALWRQAAASGVAAPAIAAAADASAVAMQDHGVLSSALAAMSLGAADQASLLAFLQTKFGWQPG